MLVLGRLIGESIMIGDTVKVTVVATERNRVRVRVARTTWPIPAQEDVLFDSWLSLNEDLPMPPDVSCILVKIARGKAWLGFIAPKDIPVNRAEIYEALHHEKSERPD